MPTGSSTVGTLSSFDLANSGGVTVTVEVLLQPLAGGGSASAGVFRSCPPTREQAFLLLAVFAGVPLRRMDVDLSAALELAGTYNLHAYVLTLAAGAASAVVDVG
ncbi:MAG TPA: hypothetical protein VES88_18540 [Gemmatimonadaceae bacterium]|nr:hypothetical protein [Gemmatimonadaceae bacterium]